MILLSVMAYAGQAPKDPCDDTVLPGSASKLISEKFTSWRVLRLSDLEITAQNSWLDSKEGKNCPGIAIGHFETKSDVSYAMLLIPREQKITGYRLVVVSKNQVSYSVRTLSKNNVATSPLVIYKVPPGKYSDADEHESVQLILDGLQMEHMERGAILFYWRSGRYRELIVSE